MIPLFENRRSGELESHLGNLEYRTQADAERVVAWIEKRKSNGPGTRSRFKQLFWIEAAVLGRGMACRVLMELPGAVPG